jgi:hypothetical protein
MLETNNQYNNGSSFIVEHLRGQGLLAFDTTKVNLFMGRRWSKLVSLKLFDIFRNL